MVHLWSEGTTTLDRSVGPASLVEDLQHELVKNKLKGQGNAKQTSLALQTHAKQRYWKNINFPQKTCNNDKTTGQMVYCSIVNISVFLVTN